MADRPPHGRVPKVPLAAALVVAALAGYAAPPPARGQGHNFAGSAQESYLFVATDPRARDQAFDGFVTEVSLKFAADVNDHVSAQAKVCYGCHGFELAMAFVDFRVADALSFRVGRFNPSFGEFPLRQDPANHATVDKPLPYDMGRMLRLRELDMSVLPIPYVDNGLEVSGTHWFNEHVQVDWAAYAVGGFRGTADGVDLDFLQSRSDAFYYVDNNSEPAGGGRVSLTIVPNDRTTFTVGASGMIGRYDPAARRSYVIVGADFYGRVGPLSMRAEYLLRRTEMALGDDPASRFAYGPGPDGEFDDWFLKDGYYVEAELDAGRHLLLVGRFDGLRRFGNVLQGSPLRSSTAVRRYTAGINALPAPGFRLKLFAQIYDFSDFEDEVTVQLAVAASF